MYNSASVSCLETISCPRESKPLRGDVKKTCRGNKCAVIFFMVAKQSSRQQQVQSCSYLKGNCQQQEFLELQVRTPAAVAAAATATARPINAGNITKKDHMTSTHTSGTRLLKHSRYPTRIIASSTCVRMLLARPPNHAPPQCIV